MVSRLAERSKQLIRQAHRPRTTSAYDSQFKLFLAFACYTDSTDIQHVQFLLCFVTYLYDCGISTSSINGYLAAIKHKFLIYGLNTDTVFTRIKAATVLTPPPI